MHVSLHGLVQTRFEVDLRISDLQITQEVSTQRMEQPEHDDGWNTLNQTPSPSSYKLFFVKGKIRFRFFFVLSEVK